MNGKLYAVGQLKLKLIIIVACVLVGDLQEEIIQSGLHFRF